MTLENYLMWVITPIICISLIIILIRFIKGPQVADRIVALDLIITSGVGLIGTFSLIYQDPTFLDTAMILALIAFLSTIAFSYYINKGDKNE
ncbi:MAG: monovalent cation/H+ antiporter complex subunit F [Bacteroidota bacterium]|nr:monovalent cation/H+ antiporter complex subunit F [Bacteroidota bacterium]